MILSMVIQSSVLLLVRLVLVITFAEEARVKFRDLKGFAKKDGIPVGLAAVVAVAELCAAFSMASGVLAQWAGIGIMLLMCGTIGMHLIKWHSPYWASKRGWEYDVLMLVLAAVVVVFGAGQFALFS